MNARDWLLVFFIGTTVLTGIAWDRAQIQRDVARADLTAAIAAGEAQVAAERERKESLIAELAERDNEELQAEKAENEAQAERVIIRWRERVVSIPQQCERGPGREYVDAVNEAIR